jgi:MFS family permease
VRSRFGFTGGSRGAEPPDRPPIFTRDFVALTGVAFFVILSTALVVPILPHYVEGPLRGGALAVGLVVGAFSAAAVMVRPPVGRFADHHGRRLLIVSGPALVSLGVAGYLLEPPLAGLVALRVVQGLGEALFFVGAVTAVGDLAPESRRSEAISYFSLAVFLAVGIGPAAGENLYAAAGFPAVWLAAAFSAGLSALLGLRVADTRPDVVPEHVHLFHRAALYPGTVMGLGILGLSGFNAFVPLYVATLGLRGAGPLFAMYSAIVLSVRSVGARIPDRVGYVRTARFAMACTATGLLVIGLVHRVAGLYAGTAMLALGISLTWPALSSFVMGSAPESERGSLMGTFTAFFDLAQGLGAVALGGVAAIAGYRGVFVAGGIGAAAGVGLLGRLRARAVQPRAG